MLIDFDQIIAVPGHTTTQRGGSPAAEYANVTGVSSTRSRLSAVAKDREQELIA